MKCRTCGSVMVIDHCESGTGATTCWHSCSLCRTVRLTSEPDARLPKELSAPAGAADDDSGYAGDPPPGALDIDAT